MMEIDRNERSSREKWPKIGGGKTPFKKFAGKHRPLGRSLNRSSTKITANDPDHHRGASLSLGKVVGWDENILLKYLKQNFSQPTGEGRREVREGSRMTGREREVRKAD